MDKPFYPLFEIGRIVISPAIHKHLTKKDVEPILLEYSKGNFGPNEEIKKLNIKNILENGNVAASYTIPNTLRKIVFVTMLSKQVTFIMSMPEYMDFMLKTYYGK